MHSCVVDMYFVIISAVITHGVGDVFQCDNFQMDQEGMKKQLAQIHKLMQYTDPELCNYLGRPYLFVSPEKATYRYYFDRPCPCPFFLSGAYLCHHRFE